MRSPDSYFSLELTCIIHSIRQTLYQRTKGVQLEGGNYLYD